MKNTFFVLLILFSLKSSAEKQETENPILNFYPSLSTTKLSSIKPADSVSIANPNHTLPSQTKINLGKILPYATPAIMVGYGLMSLNTKSVVRFDNHLQDEILEGRQNFSSPIENKLQYAPVAAVYALNMAGLKSKSNFFDRSAMYLISNSLTSFAVSFAKDKLPKLRPSGDPRSFPSGHTAIAFTGAEFMRQEYEDTPWLGYAGYAMATATGALRMIHNKHWFSDVVAGAGVGILSTKFTYWAYPWVKEKIFGNKSSNFIAMPTYNNKGFGIAVATNFK